jgi:hypothetical protein
MDAQHTGVTGGKTERRGILTGAYFITVPNEDLYLLNKCEPMASGAYIKHLSSLVSPSSSVTVWITEFRVFCSERDGGWIPRRLLKVGVMEVMQ